MFYYYGRKQKIGGKYPKPLHDTIIEPFAGSAAYSMLYWEKNVTLCEKDDKVYGVWNYLQSATEKDILSLPILEKGVSLNEDMYKSSLSKDEIHLIGFFLNPGSAVPKKSPGNFCAWNENTKKKLVEDLHKIKHWKIYHGDYRMIENQMATWFVDPPYLSSGGKDDHHGNKGFDYDTLANWTLERKGQIIVCENLGSTWLDFKPLINLKGQKHNRMEAIYYIENNGVNDGVNNGVNDGVNDGVIENILTEIPITITTKKINVSEEERKLKIDPNWKITINEIVNLTPENWFDQYAENYKEL